MQRKKVSNPVFMGGGGALDPSWYTGPTSDLPLTPQHDKSVLALDFSPNGDYVVTASSDHGLRVYNLRTGRKQRELYNKRYGHTDWVTTCAYVNDGRILSGSMDKRLCLWDKSAVRCSDLVGHNGSISKVKVDSNNVAISSAYDSALLVWKLNTLECAMGLFKGHKDSVTEFEWFNSLCVSGDRSGGIAFWDINEGKAIKTVKAHGQAVGKIALYSDRQNTNLIMTGGLKDGKLNIFDMRTNIPVKSDQVHSGSINVLTCNNSGQIVTGSADKTLKLFDLRGGSGQSMSPILTMQATDAVFCGEVVGDSNLIVTGCGDGNLLAFDMDHGGECIYGYGADNVGAVHCLKVTPDRKAVVTGGDSGEALKIIFSGF